MDEGTDETGRTTPRALRILVVVGILGVVAVTLPIFLLLILRPETLDQALSQRKFRALAKSVEAEYTEFLGLEGQDASASLIIKVFETAADLRDFVRRFPGLDSQNGAFHPPGTDILLVSRDGSDGRYEIHEIVRFLNFKYFGPLDPWLDDGLATWFEVNHADPKGGDPSGGDLPGTVEEASPSWDERSVRAAVELRPGSNLFMLRREKTRQRLIAFAMVDMLVARDPAGFPPRMKAYTGFRSDPSASKLSTPALFKKAFGLAVFEAAEAIRGRKPAMGAHGGAGGKD